jgi:5-oxoprolinase (ATP-hydrolysing)
MTTVLVHPLAGVLSAYGIGLADIIAMREQAVEAPLTAGLAARLPGLAAPLEADARAEILAEGVPAQRVTAAHRAHLRYDGTDTAVIVPVGSLEEMTAAFEAEYSRRFSFLMPDKQVIAEAVSVEVTGAADEPGADADTTARSENEDSAPAHGGPSGSRPGKAPPERPLSAAQVPMFAAGAWTQVDLFARAGLRPGQAIDGPAIITEELATTVVEPGWQAVVTDRNDLLLSRPGGHGGAGIPPISGGFRGVAPPGQHSVDPVLLEIFNNLFMSVAEQMGVRLQATAHSVNIKERLDFSCAVFDADGGLIANAPHMPVHLGSMGESIKMVIQRNKDSARGIRRGDVYVLNDPYHGGTHLPDITVVTPVFPPLPPRGPHTPPPPDPMEHRAAYDRPNVPSVRPDTVTPDPQDLGAPQDPGTGAGDERAGDECAGDERAGDERAGDERAGDEPAGDERAGGEPAGDERAGGEPAGDEIWFYVASRGHHAEIGGVSPGSMPAASTRIQQEGVLIDNWLLVEDGRLKEAETISLLQSAEYPSRDPDTNLADLRAQIAANAKGSAELHRMVEHFGLDVVHAYMGHVQENAAESVRRVITALQDGQYAYELDNGAVINVAVRVDHSRRTAEIDFTGTSPQLAGNFNAPSSVAMAAVLYVFRTLVDDDIPLNSGCLQPLKVIIPPRSMLAPEYPAAVAAGNVETSQAVTGALYAALGVMAEGSGTMNNVTFGNDRYQ